MFDRDDVDPELVAQKVLVEAFFEQARGDGRIAIFVRQAGAHGIGAVKDLLRNEGVDVFAMIPSLHRAPPGAH